MYYSDLNYADYDQYLNGQEWKEIRDYFFKHCGKYRCGICEVEERLTLHKRSYEYLTMNGLYKHYWISLLVRWYLRKNMVWLCWSCHQEVHIRKDGVKTPFTYLELTKREKYLRRKHLVKKFLNRIFSRCKLSFSV